MRVALIYFGGQYNHLIIKNLRSLGQEVIPFTPEVKVDALKDYDGLIFSGGPQSLTSGDPGLENAAYLARTMNVPRLGICLGHQLISYAFGGRVGRAVNPEYGLVEVTIEDEDTILSGMGKKFRAWESHSDEVFSPPQGFRVIATSENAKVQAIANEANSVFGVQFHPEVKHTEGGVKVFRNFIRVCSK